MNSHETSFFLAGVLAWALGIAIALLAPVPVWSLAAAYASMLGALIAFISFCLRERRQ